MEGEDRGSWRELEAESVTVGVGHGGGFWDSQRWDMNTRGTSLSGERVERFIINNAADSRWNDVLRARLVGEVCNNVEHPVPETKVLHRRSSELEFVLFRLVENRLDFAFFLDDLLVDITFWESSTLRGSQFDEVASLHILQVIPVASLDVNTIFHHDHEVFGADLAEVMSDNDSSLVLAPLLDRLKNQDSGSGIESRSGLVCPRS